MEYAEIMKYLDTIELTPGQVAMGDTKDSMLHRASLDYSVLSGTISTLYGKEQGEEFRKNYNLNRLIRVSEEDRLKIHKEFQNIDQRKDKLRVKGMSTFFFFNNFYYIIKEEKEVSV